MKNERLKPSFPFPLILLCGGKSSRMGIPKGLIGAPEEPWIETQLRWFEKAGGSGVVIVLGYAAELYLSSLRWAPLACEAWIQYHGLLCRVVINPQPALGPFSSLVTGVQEVTQRAKTAAYVLPIDVPIPKTQVWNALSDAMQGKIKASVPVCKDQGGHPALLSYELLKQLESIPFDAPNARLDVQIRALAADQIARIETSDVRVTMNLNTPLDLEKVVLPVS